MDITEVETVPEKTLSEESMDITEVETVLEETVSVKRIVIKPQPFYRVNIGDEGIFPEISKILLKVFEEENFLNRLSEDYSTDADKFAFMVDLIGAFFLKTGKDVNEEILMEVLKPLPGVLLIDKLNAAQDHHCHFLHLKDKAAKAAEDGTEDGTEDGPTLKRAN